MNGTLIELRPSVLMLMMPLIVELAFAAVPTPGMGFYGLVLHQSGYAPQGSIITAYFNDGTICGETRINAVGKYTGLVCRGKLSDTGRLVLFRVNYDKAFPTQTFVPGKIAHVNIFTEQNASVFPESPGWGACGGCLLQVVLASILVILFLIFVLGKWKKRIF